MSSIERIDMSPSVEDFLLEKADGDREIAFWLNVVCKKFAVRCLGNALEMNVMAYGFNGRGELVDKIGHIKDWLVSARHNNVDFLRDVDTQNRPKKLVYLTLEGAIDTADKYFARLNRQQRHLSGGDEETVLQFDDGIRIVRLATVAELNYEGAHMGHCIGGGGYNKKLACGTHAYYSLRDKSNKPHVTFEVHVGSNVVEQCQGKQNRYPAKKYVPYVLDFLKSSHFRVERNAIRMGLIYDSAGELHSIHDLPRDFCVDGHLNLNGTDIMTLPEGLTVSGNL